MNLIYHWFFPVVWIATSAYWVIGAGWVKQIRQTEPGSARLAHLVLSSLAYVMTFSGRFRVGPLGWEILPQNELTFFLGAGVTIMGLSFAVWARIVIGQFWSASVALKEGHRLIRMGPYALVRHPIYTGLIAGLTGTAVAVGQLRGFIAVALLTATYLWKSRREERLMVAEFGDEYLHYRKTVNALMPFPRLTQGTR